MLIEKYEILFYGKNWLPKPDCLLMLFLKPKLVQVNNNNITLNSNGNILTSVMPLHNTKCNENIVFQVLAFNRLSKLFCTHELKRIAVNIALSFIRSNRWTSFFLYIWCYSNFTGLVSSNWVHLEMIDKPRGNYSGACWSQHCYAPQLLTKQFELSVYSCDL